MIWRPPASNLLGLPHDINHSLIEWGGPGRVIFSYCRRGNAISAHFSSDKTGLKYIKGAILDFIEFVRSGFPWCKMLLAVVKRGSVARMIRKLDFEYVATSDDGNNAYMRYI